jgi:hypothetical protein
MIRFAISIAHIYSSDQIEEGYTEGHVAGMGENRNSGRVLIRKAEGRRPFEKQNLGVDRGRTLKCILKEHKLINLAQDRDSWVLL